LLFFFFPLQAAEYVPEKVKKAEKKLEENPYDLDAWSILIREAQV
jgi:cleavage stimulation factor subunit 3